MPGIHNGIGTTFRSQAFGGAPSVNPNFVSTWDTTKAGSASDTVVLPLLSGGTYNGTIDWGDGNSDSLSYANRTHVYASSGIYTITISGSDIQGFQFNNAGDRLKVTDISNWGNLNLTTNSCFYGCQNLDISATDAPTISTTSFYRMFRNCFVMSSADLSKFNTAGVTNLEECFNNCYVFTGSISTWDVSAVTTLKTCFASCYVFNDDISGWNITSNLVNMAVAFSQARAFNRNINSWDVSSVTTLEATFYDARAFNQPLNNWDVSSVTLLFNTFNGLNGAGPKTPFNQDISMWDVSSVTTMNGTFRNSSFNQNIGGWNVSSVTDMRNALNNADDFDQDLSAWDITSVGLFNDFMSNATGLSTVNYDAALIGWEATLQATWAGGTGYPYTINIKFGGSKYTGGGAADAARASLITTYGWTITDGGAV